MLDRSRRLEMALFVLILLIGVLLRFAALESIPPGLTHDEADHTHDAARVLQGDRPIYFTVGYGREPLYDYVTAVVMLVAGQGFMASRLTAALFGIALLVLVYLWVRRATRNPWLALATMAGLAVSFWGVSTSRQALRSVTLPVMFMAAALAMRSGIRIAEDTETPARPKVTMTHWSWFVLAGLFLGLSFYTYLAARIMWLIFPLFCIFLAITQRGAIRRIWPGLFLMLSLAALIAAPLASYLITHPAAEARIDQLSGPIDALFAGKAKPLLRNIQAGLAMITLRGDDLWLYNIPGKPLLGPVISILFYLGLGLAIFNVLFPSRPILRGHTPGDDSFRLSTASVFMLLTLAAGLTPALITGVGASNTRVIGMQPALYYFPALAVAWLADRARRHVGQEGARALWVSYGALILVLGGLTIRDYFSTWANARDVRVAYHTTLVEALHYLDRHPEIGPDIAMSTITPGYFHDPAVARATLKRDDLRIRWFDGRLAMIFPAPFEQPPTLQFYPQVASPDPAFSHWGGVWVGQITLRPDDFNNVVNIIKRPGVGRITELAIPQLMRVGDLLEFHGFEIRPSSQAIPGDQIEMLTAWRVLQTTDAEVVLFTHALNESNQVLAQQDLLSVPSWGWFEGDYFVQWHRFSLPPDTPPGLLRIMIGAYTTPDILRLPLFAPDDTPLGDSLLIYEVKVVAP